jgi:phenylacetate-CoA ligase
MEIKMPNFARIAYNLAMAMRRLHWKEEKLKKYQEKRLRSVVKNAYDSVPFYHELFKKYKIGPNSVKTVKDLEKIPVVKKEDLRSERLRRLLSSKFDYGKLKQLRTSGSTGEPFRFCISKEEDEWRKAIYLRANMSCGQRLRDNWVVVTAPHHFYDTTRIQKKLRILSQTCISIFTKVEEQAELVSKARPDVLDGYSGSLFLLAKEISSGSETIRPRIVFGTADLTDNVSRRYMEDVFQAPFYDQFGCAEVDRTAWQCPEKGGYHMDVDSVITQFADGNGEEVSDGERGEIVYTSLFNYAQPFIRYSIGDIGVPLSDDCSCDRRLPLMKIVEGRKDSFLVLPDGRLLSPMTFWTIMRYFEQADDIDRFQVVQKKLTALEIYVKTRNGSASNGRLEKKLVQHIRKCLQADISWTDITVKFVEDIPIDKTGRLRSVICELPELSHVS